MREAKKRRPSESTEKKIIIAKKNINQTNSDNKSDCKSTYDDSSLDVDDTEIGSSIVNDFILVHSVPHTFKYCSRFIKVKCKINSITYLNAIFRISNTSLSIII